MKKPKTYAEVVQVEQDGLLVRGWKKKCICCGKEFTTTSRSQKFCSNECSKKAQTKRRKQQKEYDANKEIIRLSARSHAIAVEVLNWLEKKNILLHECACCGSVDNLQVHHKDQRWLNNSPENLMWVCPKCHAKIHSDISKDMQDKGQTYEDIYDEVEFQVYGQILKS